MYSSLFVNEKTKSKKFKTAFNESLKKANGLRIATGYIGAATITELEPDLLKLAIKGECKILIGMIYHGGVTKKQKDALVSLDTQLRSISASNGIYISARQYHGKIYQFEDEELYMGSSNFSNEGLFERLEATSLIENEILKSEINDYINYLFNLETTHKLENVELKVMSKKSAKPTPSRDLKDYEIDVNEFPDEDLKLGTCSITLHVDDQPRSSLNLYFDKGRYSRTTEKYAPRPWYEVEITARTSDMASEFYPETIPNPTKPNSKSRSGSFFAYIKFLDKYYKIKMRVSADNGKNIASDDQSGGRATLGRILKGKLEEKGLLKEGERITSEILEEYGTHSIKLHKIDADSYILEF